MRALLAALLGMASSLVAAADAPFLWTVQGPAATHYLAGSVHLLPESVYPLPPAFETAYGNTRGLVLESDPAALAAPETQARMLRDGLAPEGLRAEVSPVLFQRTQQAVQALELPTTACDRFRAWFCALTLGVIEFQRAGLDARLGLDQHFFDRASRDDRAIGWLEAPEEQLQLFAGMSRELSEQFLASTLEDLDRPEMEPAALVRLWQTNDAAGIEKLSADAQRRYPAATARLLGDRNRAWITPLQTLLDGPQPQFIIVGAAHLVGPEGLVTLLRARGYRVEPVTQGDAGVPEAPAP